MRRLVVVTIARSVLGISATLAKIAITGRELNVVHELLPAANRNRAGGSIAVSAPVDASTSRILVTLLREMLRDVLKLKFLSFDVNVGKG